MENLNVIVTETPEVIKVTITDYQEIVTTFIKEQSGSDFVREAPIDGSTYGRKDKAWTDISGKVDGTGTTNYVAKWLDTDTIQDSVIFDDGTNIGIGTSSPSEKLEVDGIIKVVHTDSSYAKYRGQGVFFNRSDSYLAPEVDNSSTLNVGYNGGKWGNVEINGSFIKFENGANETMRIDANGKVGIGTTSPLGNLDVTGNNPTLFLVDSGGAANSKRRFLQSNSHKLYFGRQDDIGGSTVYDMLIDSNGNIGIGTTSPSYKLHVIGTSRLEGRVTLGGNVNNFIQGTGSSLDFKSNGEYNFTKGSDTLLRILSNGNVGIGTTSPSQKLDVEGNVIIRPLNTTDTISFQNLGSNQSRLVTTNNFAIFNGSIETARFLTTGGFKLAEYGSGTFTGTATQRLGVDTSGNVIEIPIGSGAVDGAGTTNFVTKWIDTDTVGDSVIFDNGTNVGIGTTNPTQLLDVVGANAEIVISDSNDAPALRFRNSGSTAAMVEANSAKDMLFKTGGVAEQMRITSIGNVGIGTTNPTRELEVQGTGNVYIKVAASTDDDSSSIELENTQNTWTIRNDDTADDALKFQSAGGTKATILKNGNVGIGTTTPSSTLQVNNNSSSLGGEIRVTNNLSTASTGQSASISLGREFEDRSIRLSSVSNGPYGINPDLVITGNKNAVGATHTELFRIKNNGNVGIGTSAPVGKLEVVTTDANRYIRFKAPNGEERFQFYTGGTGNASALHMYSSNGTLKGVQISAAGTTFFNGGNVGIGTTSPSEKLEVSGNILSSSTSNTFIDAKATGANAYIRAYSDSNSVWLYQGGSSSYLQSQSGSTLRLGSGTSNLVITDNSGEVMRTSSGNVGIGTTSPSQKLQVVSDSIVMADFTTTSTKGGIKIAEADEGGFLSTEANRICLGSSIGVSANNLTYHMGTNKLGIGTASPTNKLDVLDSSNTYVARFRGASATYVQSGDATLSGESGFLARNSTGQFFIAVGGGVAALTGTGGANTMTFGVGGAEKMRIASTGNVGIGTTSPGYQLEVSGNAALSLGADRYLRIGSSTNYWWDLQSVSNDFTLKEAGSNTRLIVKAGGNVGIGTTSPEAKLDVESEILISGTDPILRMERGDGFNSDILKVESSTDNLIIGDTSLDDIIFEADNGEAMRISRTLNVGIGTTNPITKLHLFNPGYPQLNLESNGGSWQVGVSSGNDFAFRKGSTGSDYPLWLDSSGNIGIGNTSPSAKLDIVSSSTNTVPFRVATSNGVSGGNFYEDTSGYLWFQMFDTSANEKVRIRTNSSSFFNGGNVGIGTTSPQTDLNVVSATGAKLRLGTSNTTVLAGDTIGRLEFFSADANNSTSGLGAFIDLVADGDQSHLNPNADLRFATSYASAQPATTRMTIKGNGNVGIGTTSPGTKLDVNGNISIATTSGSTASNQISMVGSRAIFGYDGNIASAFMRSSDTSKPLVFGSGTSEFMRIVSSTGNVGIGTTNPGGHRLNVHDGNIAITGGTSSTLYMNLTSNQVYGDVNGVVILKANDNLRINTNGAERVRVISSGNVGIGTTAPSRLLDVDGIQGWSEGTNIEKAYLNPTSTGTDFHLLGNNGNIRFDSRSGSNSYINTGNLGIGTTNPNATLDIENSTGVTVDINSSSGDGQFRFQDNGITKWAVGRDNTQQDFVFSSSAGLSTDPVVVLKHSTGNLGIGTTSPSQKLEVNGNIQASSYKIAGATVLQGNANVIIGSGGATGKIQLNTISGTGLVLDGSNVGIGVTSPSAKLEIGGLSGSASGLVLTAISSVNVSFGFLVGDTTLGLHPKNLVIAGSSGASDIAFSPSSIHPGLLMLDGSAGNVGIGTTSPSYKLDVVGTFRANNFGSIQGVDTGNPSAVNNEVRISGYGIMGNRGSLYFTNRLAAGTLQFGIGGVHGSGTKMLINSDGYVGIGITGPQEKLHIIGSTLLSNNNSYKIERIDGTNIPVVKLSSSNVVEFGAATSTSGATMFNFKTSGDASRMVILGSGNVGIGTTSPQALLDVSSTINGVLLPRMTTTQVNAISSPSNGLTVYNITLNTLCFYNGSSWQKVNHATM